MHYAESKAYNFAPIIYTKKLIIPDSFHYLCSYYSQDYFGMIDAPLAIKVAKL